MLIHSKTYKQSVYDIINALRKHGVEKDVFGGETQKKKSKIYGGDKCLEICPMINIIENPLTLFPIIPGRGNHFPMQLAELIWVIQGKTNISEFFGQFASKAVQEFSHNTDELYAAYGYRIRSQPKGNDVLKYVINTLQNKITSRSAVIPLFNSEMDTMGGEHKPCATTMSFHYFNGKLDGILTLRANDLIKGYSAINYLEFAFLLAIVAYCIEAPIGRFVNFTNTMHYYTGAAATRIQQIESLQKLKAPDPILEISDIFDVNVKLKNRYSSILSDVNNIYVALGTSKKEISNPKLVHPIFKHIYQILRGIKYKKDVSTVAKNLPEFLSLPLLENLYRDKAEEVERFINEGKNEYREAIRWRKVSKS